MTLWVSLLRVNTIAKLADRRLIARMKKNYTDDKGNAKLRAVRVFTLSERANKFREKAGLPSFVKRAGSDKILDHIKTTLPAGAETAKARGRDLSSEEIKQLKALGQGSRPNNRKKSKRQSEESQAQDVVNIVSDGDNNQPQGLFPDGGSSEVPSGYLWPSEQDQSVYQAFDGNSAYRSIPQQPTDMGQPMHAISQNWGQMSQQWVQGPPASNPPMRPQQSGEKIDLTLTDDEGDQVLPPSYAAENHIPAPIADSQPRGRKRGLEQSSQEVGYQSDRLQTKRQKTSHTAHVPDEDSYLMPANPFVTQYKGQKRSIDQTSPGAEGPSGMESFKRQRLSESSGSLQEQVTRKPRKIRPPVSNYRPIQEPHPINDYEPSQRQAHILNASKPGTVPMGTLGLQHQGAGNDLVQTDSPAAYENDFVNAGQEPHIPSALETSPLKAQRHLEGPNLSPAHTNNTSGATNTSVPAPRRSMSKDNPPRLHSSYRVNKRAAARQSRQSDLSATGISRGLEQARREEQERPSDNLVLDQSPSESPAMPSINSREEFLAEFFPAIRESAIRAAEIDDRYQSPSLPNEDSPNLESRGHSPRLDSEPNQFSRAFDDSETNVDQQVPTNGLSAPESSARFDDATVNNEDTSYLAEELPHDHPGLSTIDEGRTDMGLPESSLSRREQHQNSTTNVENENIGDHRRPISISSEPGSPENDDEPLLTPEDFANAGFPDFDLGSLIPEFPNQDLEQSAYHSSGAYFNQSNEAGDYVVAQNANQIQNQIDFSRFDDLDFSNVLPDDIPEDTNDFGPFLAAGSTPDDNQQRDGNNTTHSSPAGSLFEGDLSGEEFDAELATAPAPLSAVEDLLSQMAAENGGSLPI